MKLKPCPFCGSKAEMLECNDVPDGPDDCIECSLCMATTAESCTKDGGAAKCNARADEPVSVEDAIQLDTTIDTVGALRALLAPFTGECQVTPINVYYAPIDGGKSAYLLFKTNPMPPAPKEGV